MPEQNSVTLITDAMKMNSLAQQAKDADLGVESALFTVASAIYSTGAALWWKLHKLEDKLEPKKGWFR